MQNSIKLEANRLIDKIVVIKSNPHYRMADVVYRKGLRFQDSTEKVRTLPEFDGTILKDYILEVPNIEDPNIELLFDIVMRRVDLGIVHLPLADELVIHVRAGDVVEHSWFLKKDFEAEIAQYTNVRRCAIVTCFAFQEFFEKGWWLFSDAKLEENKVRFLEFLTRILRKFPDIEFDVVSNKLIDYDFVYMIMANYFISDEGGFSELVCDVRRRRAAVL